jgi:hypothetical protein
MDSRFRVEAGKSVKLRGWVPVPDRHRERLATERSEGDARSDLARFELRRKERRNMDDEIASPGFTRGSQ